MATTMVGAYAPNDKGQYCTTVIRCFASDETCNGYDPHSAALQLPR